jgi:hypothetical protein
VDISAAHADARDDQLKITARPLVTGVLLLLGTSTANGDGGTVRMRATQDGLVVTVFTAPEPLRVGFIDVSVLIQDEVSGSIVEAPVTITLADEHSGAVIRAEATRAQGTNKLLQAARVTIPAPGTRRLEVSVRRLDASVDLACDLIVASPAPRITVISDLLMMPLFAIALFVVNQALRRRLQRTHGQRRVVESSSL